MLTSLRSLVARKVAHGDFISPGSSSNNNPLRRRLRVAGPMGTKEPLGGDHADRPPTCPLFTCICAWYPDRARRAVGYGPRLATVPRALFEFGGRNLARQSSRIRSLRRTAAQDNRAARSRKR